MNIERRLLIISLISLGVLFFFNNFNKTKNINSKQAVNPITVKSQAVSSSEQKNVPAAIYNNIPVEDKNLKQVKISLENFTLTIIPKGGYIKALKINKYGDVLVYKNLLYTPETKDFVFKIVQTGNVVSLIYEGKNGQITKKIVLKSDFGIDFSIINGLDKSIKKVLLFSTTQQKSFNS